MVGDCSTDAASLGLLLGDKDLIFVISHKNHHNNDNNDDISSRLKIYYSPPLWPARWRREGTTRFVDIHLKKLSGIVSIGN